MSLSIRCVLIAGLLLLPEIAGCEPSDSLRKSVRTLLKEGRVSQSKSDVLAALQTYFDALRKAEAIQDPWSIATASEHIAGVYGQYDRYQESVPYLLRAYQFFRSTDSLAHFANLANGIAWANIKLDRIDSARKYAEVSVNAYRSMPERSIMDYCRALESLGEIYSLSGLHVEANAIFTESLSLGMRSNNEVIVGFTRYGLALDAYNRKDYSNSWNHLSKMVPVAEKYATGVLLAGVYKLAYRILDASGRTKEAYVYLKKYQELSEKLQAEDVEKKAAIVNANFEISKKEDELQILSQRNAIQQLEIERQALIRNLSIGGFVMLLIMGGFVINYIQSRRKFERKELTRKNQELEQARVLQLSLIPQKPFADDSFAVSGKMHTATEVGGDYFDFFRLDTHRMLVVFGDATGHGMAAGMMVTIAKVAIVNSLGLLKESNNLVPVVRAINDSIFSTTTVKGVGMAVQLAVIDARSQTLAITSCGMPYPLILDRTLGSFTPLEIRQPPLGFLREIRAKVSEHVFTKNHVLLLVSDGILERFNQQREEYGMDRLSKHLLGNQQKFGAYEALLDDLFSANNTYAEGLANHDDMTALCAGLR